MNDIKGKRVLLYSGGMDSWLIDKLWKPDVKLFVDINTPSSNAEKCRLPYDVIVTKLDLSMFERKTDFILPLRNLYLIAIASYYGDEICLGANKTDINNDKTPEFADKMSDLLSYLYEEQKWTEKREIKVNVDYKKYTKGELISMYVKEGGNLDDVLTGTFSCFTPISGVDECWNCRACFLKFMALAENNYDFPKDILEKIKPYLNKKVYSPNYNDRIYSKLQVIRMMTYYGLWNDQDGK